MLHLKVKRFIIGAKDWSGEVSVAFLVSLYLLMVQLVECDDHVGHPDQLLEFDKLALGTM